MQIFPVLFCVDVKVARDVCDQLRNTVVIRIFGGSVRRMYPKARLPKASSISPKVLMPVERMAGLPVRAISKRNGEFVIAPEPILTDGTSHPPEHPNQGGDAVHRTDRGQSLEHQTQRTASSQYTQYAHAHMKSATKNPYVRMSRTLIGSTSYGASSACPPD